MDDDPIDRLRSETTLVRLGLDVRSAADTGEALDLLGREAFDLIFAACSPGDDGFETPRRIRGLTGFGRTPIIALLSDANGRRIDDGESAMLDDTLEKPIAESELARVLRRWFPDGPASGSADGERVAAPAVVEATLDALAAAFGDAPGGLAGVVTIFSDTIIAERARLRGYVASEDSDAIGRSAHRMAGAALQIGARVLGTCCKRIESAARGGTIEAAASDLRAIDSLIAAVRQELAAYLERHPQAAAT